MRLSRKRLKQIARRAEIISPDGWHYQVVLHGRNIGEPYSDRFQAMNALDHLSKRWPNRSYGAKRLPGTIRSTGDDYLITFE